MPDTDGGPAGLQHADPAWDHSVFYVVRICSYVYVSQFCPALCAAHIRGGSPGGGEKEVADLSKKPVEAAGSIGTQRKVRENTVRKSAFSYFLRGWKPEEDRRSPDEEIPQERSS